MQKKIKSLKFIKQYKRNNAAIFITVVLDKFASNICKLSIFLLKYLADIQILYLLSELYICVLKLKVYDYHLDHNKNFSIMLNPISMSRSYRS